jgi:tetratricopeptide (TPR) repeat protein
MPHRHVSRTLPSPPLWLVLGTLIAALGGCASKPADATTTSAGTVEASAKIPITTTSADAKALFLQGRSLIEQLRLHDGRALIEQAVAKDSTFAIAHYYLATSASSAKARTEEMKVAVAQAGAASEGERLMILALQARVNANPVKALQYIEQLVEKFPQDERAHFALGAAYVAQKEYERAIAEFKLAIQIDSTFSPAYNSLGYDYRAVSKYDDAEAVFKKYIQLIPNDPNPYDSYAELLMKAGRFDESITQYTKALSEDPHFSGSFVGIATDRMLKGQQDEAIAEARRLYDSARDDGERRTALFTQAVANVDAGKSELALKSLAAEYELDTRIADTANMAVDAVALGDVLLDAGKPDAARAKYSQALDLVTASSQSEDVKADAKLADRYNQARVALAKHDRATAEADAADYASGARARYDAIRIAQAHELAGLIALDEQKFGVAAAELGAADQQNPSVLYALARAYQGAGDAAKAKSFAGAAANSNTLATLPYAFVRMKAKKMA